MTDRDAMRAEYEQALRNYEGATDRWMRTPKTSESYPRAWQDLNNARQVWIAEWKRFHGRSAVV